MTSKDLYEKYKKILIDAEVPEEIIEFLGDRFYWEEKWAETEKESLELIKKIETLKTEYAECEETKRIKSLKRQLCEVCLEKTILIDDQKNVWACDRCHRYGPMMPLAMGNSRAVPFEPKGLYKDLMRTNEILRLRLSETHLEMNDLYEKYVNALVAKDELVAGYEKTRNEASQRNVQEVLKKEQ